MEQKYILALEIGSSKIKGAVGVLDNDGMLSITAIEEERIIDSVRHGLIINVDTVANRITSILRKLENRVSPRKARSLYLGIGGRSFRSAPRHVERRLPVEEEITHELIEQLRGEALATALSDRDVVDVTDGKYHVDGKLRTQPEGVYGREISATFNLISCRQQVLRNIRRTLNERLNLKINKAYVRQVAEADLVLSNDERLQGCMLVDLGAETTTVSIYHKGGLTYMATLPMGSRNITRDIMVFNHVEERAEEIKKIGGNAVSVPLGTSQNIDGIDFTEINNYVHARAAEIVANITEQIRYAGLHPSDLGAGIILVGGGAKLKNFNALLSDMTKMKVRCGMPSYIVRIADTRINGYDSIDVISIISAAARDAELPVVDCMVDTSAPKPTETTEAKATEATPTPEPEAQEEEKLATGSNMFSDDDDDDDVLKDDEPKTKVRKRGFFTAFVNKVENMLKDPEDDEFMREDDDNSN